MRSNIDTSGTMNFFKTRYIVLLNILSFVAAFHAVDISMTDEAAIIDEVLPPHEVLLPHITVTDEMKIGMFFDKLRIDYSIIKPKNIMRSINPWEPYIQQYSGEYGVDSDLVRAIIYAESKGDPYCISHDGALGLMQIMPSTADFVGIRNVLDPEENIKAGVKYIAWLVKNFDEQHVLWAWNAGPSRISKHQMPGETKKFIVEVLSVKYFLKDDKSNTI